MFASLISQSKEARQSRSFPPLRNLLLSAFLKTVSKSSKVYPDANLAFIADLRLSDRIVHFCKLLQVFVYASRMA